MNISSITDYFIRTVLPVTEYALLESIFNTLEKLGDLELLDIEINDVLVNRPVYETNSETVIYIKQMVIDHCRVNVIPKHVDMIISNKPTTTLTFLSGVLSWLSTVNEYNPVVTQELASLLSNTEQVPGYVVGEIVNVFYNEFVPTDAIDMIDNVSSDSLATHYNIALRTISVIEEDPDELHDLFITVTSTDIGLVNTKLFQHLITNNIFDTTIEYCVGFINSKLDETITSVEVADELVVTGIVTNTGLSELTDLVDILLEEYDTALIVRRLREVFEEVM